MPVAGGYAKSDVGQKTTLIYIDRDRNPEVSLCAPSAKTTSFAIVPPDGISVALDAAGNAKAAELIKSNGGKSPINVTVNGTS